MGEGGEETILPDKRNICTICETDILTADCLLLLFLKINLFIYSFLFLSLAALGLHCCARAFSSCSEWGLLFVVVRGLLIAVASLVVEHGL